MIDQFRILILTAEILFSGIVCFRIRTEKGNHPDEVKTICISPLQKLFCLIRERIR